MAINFFCSTLHIDMARKAIATIGPDDAEFEQRDGAISAILFCALSLEAIINELPLSVRASGAPLDDRLRALADILEQAENYKAQLQQKFQLARFALTGKTYDRGASPFQDFALLIDIRNALVHLKPEVLTEIEPHRLVSRLSMRTTCRALKDGEVSAWINVIANRSVAEWALSAVKAMCIDLAQCLGKDRTRLTHVMLALGELLPADLPAWDGVD